MHPEPSSPNSFDVVVLGGALSGAASAFLLLEEDPTLKILIVERSTQFTRRVGEATVEVSTYFLARRLGLTRYLHEHHLAKNGLRFWFANEKTTSIDECSEIGGAYLARVPAYLVDRATLDEEVLKRACSAGAEVWRPAVVEEVELVAGGMQQVRVKRGDQTVQVSARWVVDASGVAAFLARKKGWLQSNTEHPTAAVWARWKGCKDLDDPEFLKRYPEWGMACYGIRGSATNHLMGKGWWAWWIPLKGGDVSVGVTFDQRLVTFPSGGALGDRLKAFLSEHPVGRELLVDATWIEGDVHWRKNLPYCSTTFAGDGFALVGDAAGFIDPFYSPGMDWISFTSSCAVDLVMAQRKGEPMAERLGKYNEVFTRSYDRWFRGIYKDKYEYFNEYDLMKMAFVLDLGFYYLGVVNQPFRRGKEAFMEPVFSTKPSVPFYYFMRAYNRRFAAIARRRRELGLLGRMNDRKRFMFPGFTLSRKSVFPLISASLGWLFLELREGWRTWGKSAQSSPAERTPEPSTIAAQHS